MLTAYFDESEIFSEIDMLFLCGWIASVSEWQQFEFDWRLLLAKYDVPYLHMKEFVHSNGPFAKWKGKEGTRRKFISDAAEIVRSNTQYGFSCCVSKQIFEKVGEVYELQNYFPSPYAFAGRTCAAMAELWAQRHGCKSSEVEYVFEDSNRDKAGLLRAMTEIRLPMPSPIFKPGRDSKPSSRWPEGRKGLVQLQAADYLAYEFGKFAKDFRQIETGKKRMRASLGVLPKEKIKWHFLQAQHIALICRGLKIPRKEVVHSNHENAKGQTA